MTEGPDYDEAKQIFEKSMKDALAHLDQVSAEVSKAKEQAIDQELAAKEELKRIQRDAEKLSEEFINQHRKQYDERVRRDTLMEVCEKLIAAGRTTAELRAWLDVDPEMIQYAFTYMGYEDLKGRPASVTYINQGRSGYVVFNWDGQQAKFYYEFGGGSTLAIIDLPNTSNWEKDTGLKLEDRDTVITFMAKRIIKDQAPNRKYFINADHILIA